VFFFCIINIILKNISSETELYIIQDISGFIEQMTVYPTSWNKKKCYM